MAKYVRHITINESSSGSIDLSGTTGNKGLLFIECDEGGLDNSYKTTGVTVGGVALSQLSIPDTAVPANESHVEVWAVDDDNSSFAALSGASETISISGTVSNRKYVIIVIDEINTPISSSFSIDWAEFTGGGNNTISNTLDSGAADDFLLHFLFTETTFDAGWTIDASLTENFIGNLGSPASGLGFGYKTLSGTETSQTYTITTTQNEQDWNSFLLRINNESTDVTGTLVTTLEDSTSNATGKEGKQGTLTVTLEDSTVAASGKEGKQGTLAVTLEDAVATATGQEGKQGTLAVTLDDATANATGTVVANTGTLAKTTDNATLNATGTSTAPSNTTGVAQITTENSISSATGTIGVSGTSATTTEDSTVIALGIVGSGLPNLAMVDNGPDWLGLWEFVPASALGQAPHTVAISSGGNINRIPLDAATTTEASVTPTESMYAPGGLLQNIRLAQAATVWLEDDSEVQLTNATTLNIQATSADYSGTVANGYDATSYLATLLPDGSLENEYYVVEVTQGSLDSYTNAGQWTNPDRATNTTVRTRVFNTASKIWRTAKTRTFKQPESFPLFLNTQVPPWLSDFTATLLGEQFEEPIKRGCYSSGDHLDVEAGATTEIATFQPTFQDFRKNAALANTPVDATQNFHVTDGFNESSVLSVNMRPPDGAPDGVVRPTCYAILPADRTELPENSIAPIAAKQGDKFIILVTLGSMAFNPALGPIFITSPATTDLIYFNEDLGWSTVQRNFYNIATPVVDIAFDTTIEAREGWDSLTLGPSLDAQSALSGLVENSQIEFPLYGGELSISTTGVPTNTGRSRYAQLEQHNGMDWDVLPTYIPGQMQLLADLTTAPRDGWTTVQLDGSLDANALPGLVAGEQVEYDTDNGDFVIRADGVAEYLGVDSKLISYEFHNGTTWTAAEYSTAPAVGIATPTTEDSTSNAVGFIGVAGTATPTTENSTSVGAGTIGVKGTGQATLEDAVSSATGATGTAGTLAVTTEDVVVNATGRFSRPNTLAVTTEDATLVANGTFTKPQVSGSAVVFLDNASSTASGVHKQHKITANPTTEDSVVVASGFIGVQGTATPTTEDSTVSATGEARPAVSGSVVVQLEDAVSVAQGGVAQRPEIRNSFREYNLEFPFYNSYRELDLDEILGITERVV